MGMSNKSIFTELSLDPVMFLEEDPFCFGLAVLWGTPHFGFSILCQWNTFNIKRNAVHIDNFEFVAQLTWR
jgi:hypothetical protein